MALSTTNLLGRLAAVAASLAALLATSAWVFYADDRRPSRSARIGTLSVELPEGSGTGTAFLIDECGILTNFHVVFGPWYVTALRPPSHDFTGTFTLTEVTLPDGSHPSARAIPVVWGDYLGPERQWRRPEEDWAYLTLDRCLGAQYGYFDLREADLYEPPVDKGFTAIGYSAGRQMVDPGCAARADPEPGRKGWLHDCALLPGDSGAPIFHSSTLTVVALGSGYRAQAGNGDCLSAMPGPGEKTGQKTDGQTGAGWPRAWPRAWTGGCANVAVPITAAIRDRTWDAMNALCLQHVLARRGYDTGARGVIEAPQLQAAIQQVQRDLDWNIAGWPLHHLCTMQWLRLSTY